MASSSTSPSPSRTLLVLLGVSIPVFMIILDTNAVGVALPSIGRTTHADFSVLEWIINAYTVCLASLLLTAGTLADHFGRRKLLLWGLGVFSFASLACGLATAGWELMAARALQGLGAACQLSAGLAILGHTFRGAEKAKAFAFWGSVYGIAMTLGPIIGGLITAAIGWRWIFFINIPVGLLAATLTWMAIDESRDPHGKSIDLRGIVLLSGMLFFFSSSLIATNREAWTSTPVLRGLIVAVALLVLLIVAERSQRRGMIDPQLFSNPMFVAAGLSNLAYGASFFTMMTWVPMQLESTFGFSPVWAGLGMLPLAAPLFIVPRYAVIVGNAIGQRALLCGSFVLMFAGLSWMSLTARVGDYPLYFVGLLLAGISAGVLNGETMKVGIVSVPVERSGMASGATTTLRFIGIIVGIAAFGSLLVHHGMQLVMLVAAIVAGAAAIICFPLVRVESAGAAAKVIPLAERRMHETEEEIEQCL